MDTNGPANLHDLGNLAYELFLWPGTFILSQLGTHAPGLGIPMDGNGVALPAFVSGVVWTLLGFLSWQALRSACMQILYAGRRLRIFLICKLQKATRRRQLRHPVAIPEVEFDDLDMAILNTGMTLPPGLALTAAELSGQLTRRPEQLQRRLEKLRKYGLVDGALGETDGYDNYRLTRSGATLVSMWHREDGVAL